MRTIGMTGGVGAGKSKVLSYIKNKYNCMVIMADQVGHKVKEPGQPCYDTLIGLLGKDILDKEGWIQNEKMGAKIFADDTLLLAVNQLIHPAVKQEIQERITQERVRNKLDFLFVEAALLLEDGYSKILDEIWYIYANEEIRRSRLMEYRSYSKEKIDLILRRQLSEEAFREACVVFIDNSGSLEETYRQIDEKLEGYL